MTAPALAQPAVPTPSGESVATAAARIDYTATRDLVVNAAHRELDAFWASTADMPPAEREKATVAFMKRLVKTYGDVAGQAAADYLVTEWSEWGEPYSSLPVPTPVGPPKPRYVERSTNWALQTLAGGLAEQDPAEVLERLRGMVTRHLLSGANKTVAAGARQAGVKFARVAESGACPFCKMLASRGGVYHDATTASKWHDNCRCTPVQVRDDAELPESSHRLMREWAEWADNHDGQPTLAAWEQHHRDLAKAAKKSSA